MANPTLYREFIMVSTKSEGAANSMYYVGLPNEKFMAAFDGFERVEETELPKIIDTLRIADATTDEFKSRFEFKHRR